MLKKLLTLATVGGVQSSAHLSRELQVGEGLVCDMVRDLTRMGYLRPITSDCRACHRGCFSSGACTTGQRGRAWALTEKGRQASRTRGVRWKDDRSL
jgi:hypothetical protein